MSEATDNAVKTVQMNQLPTDAMTPAQSPLHHADLPTLAAHASPDVGVTVQELALLDHLVMRGDSGHIAFSAGVESALGMPLPTPLQSTEKAGQVIRWISPDEWLITAPTGTGFMLEQQLRDAIGETHFAITNVSGGQTVLTIGGPDVEAVLKKSTPYDIHISNMPVGKVVTSLFGKAQAVIRRTGEQSFELVIRRSFADYCWLWLQDASREFGL